MKYCKEEFIDKAAIFDEKIYDWSDEKIDDYLAKNSENDIVYIKFSYKQLGRDEKWFRKQCRALNNDQSKINREILLQWNKGTELSPFPPELIDRLRTYSGTVLNTVVVNESYLLNIYEHFDWTDKLLIGGDFGGSTTKDNTCFSVTDPKTLHVVADFKNNKINSIEAADVVYELMTKFFPNSIFIPENNAYSEGCVSLLLKTELASRIYFEYKMKPTERKMQDGTIKKEKVKVKSYGIDNTTHSRPLMMEIVFDIVENGYKDVISPLVIEDIAGLERKRNGKIEHSDSPGCHDDSLFSYLMVRYVIAYGNNLARFRIYKATTTNVEQVANTGVKSDEEFVKNFSSVLKSNFGVRTAVPTQFGDLQSDIINEFREQQSRRRELEEQYKFENHTENMNTSSLSRIFALNGIK